MTKRKRGRKTLNKNSNYHRYKNKTWFKALMASQKLNAAEKQLKKYTALVAKLRVRVKRFK